MSIDLETIFDCDDQSALIHNYVANQDPPPNAWSRKPEPQSPLGQFSFPEVLAFPQGKVFTLRPDGQAISHELSQHRWLPWRYWGETGELAVERAVAKDTWLGRIRMKCSQRTLLALECRKAHGLEVRWERLEDGLVFRWGDRFDAYLTFEGSAAPFNLAESSDNLIRPFAENWAFPRENAWSPLLCEGPIWIGIPFEDTMTVQFSVVKSGDARPPRLDLREAQQRERRRWEEFFHEHVPCFETEDPVLRDTYYFSWLTLWANRCEGGSPALESPFISPSRLHYGSQWWWDEAFHAVVLRHSKKPENLYLYFENFWRAQGEDGGIPGCIRFAVADGTQKTESLGFVTMEMQPPVLGLVLDLLKERPGWPADLAALYEPLVRLADWHLSPKRDTDQDGLAEYHHSFNTSSDQTQRWDSQLFHPEKVIDHMRPTESVDYNVWMSLLWQNLAAMAEILGRADAARAHTERAQLTMRLVDQWIWDEKDGFYYDIDGTTHEKIRVKTPYGFMPLLSSFAKPERIERLVREHLLNPKEFWCEWPLPSVSLDHPTFDPVNMWRGPTWVNLNWMVVEGLSRQGYFKEAALLARKTVDLVGSRYHHGRRVRSPRIWEWYHPHTGEELGNNQYSWTALVVDLILRFVAPTATGSNRSSTEGHEYESRRHHF